MLHVIVVRVIERLDCGQAATNPIQEFTGTDKRTGKTNLISDEGFQDVSRTDITDTDSPFLDPSSWIAWA
jgi:hypothetical protein